MSTKIDAPADDITLPAYRCIKPNCPVSCSDCNHAIPGSDVARLLVVRLLDEFGNDDRDGPYEEGEHPLVDEARAFLCSSPADCVGGWISVAERLPEVGIDVLVYEPSRPDDWPGTLRVYIDHISEDYEGWYSHGEAYEHYLAVAGADVTCTGLSEKASYTHWMPLPAAPGQAALPAAVDVGAAQAETAQAAPARCSYCDGTGDVHGLDGEWRGECTECPVAITRTFKNFHRSLCVCFGYTHDEKDWQRDLVSLEEHVAKLAAQAAPVVPAGYALVPLEPTEEMLDAGAKHVYAQTNRNDCEHVWSAMVAAASPGATHGN